MQASIIKTNIWNMYIVGVKTVQGRKEMILSTNKQRKRKLCAYVMGYALVPWNQAAKKSPFCLSLWWHDDVIKWKHFPCYWPFARVTSGFPSQRPVTRSPDVFFDEPLNKRWSKQAKRRCMRRHRAHYDVIVMPNGTSSHIRAGMNVPKGFYVSSWCK